MTQLNVEVFKAESIPGGIFVRTNIKRDSDLHAFVSTHTHIFTLLYCRYMQMDIPPACLHEKKRDRKKILSRHDRKWTSLLLYMLLESYYSHLHVLMNEQNTKKNIEKDIRTRQEWIWWGRKFACRLKHDVNREKKEEFYSLFYDHRPMFYCCLFHSV